MKSIFVRCCSSHDRACFRRCYVQKHSPYRDPKYQTAETQAASSVKHGIRECSRNDNLNSSRYPQARVTYLQSLFYSCRCFLVARPFSSLQTYRTKKRKIEKKEELTGTTARYSQIECSHYFQYILQYSIAVWLVGQSTIKILLPSVPCIFQDRISTGSKKTGTAGRSECRAATRRQPRRRSHVHRIGKWRVRGFESISAEPHR